MKRLCEIHLVVPDKFAGFVLGKNGSRIQKTASKSGCKASRHGIRGFLLLEVWMTSRNGTQDRRVIVIGNYKRLGCIWLLQRAFEQVFEAFRTGFPSEAMQDRAADRPRAALHGHAGGLARCLGGRHRLRALRSSRHGDGQARLCGESDP